MALQNLEAKIAIIAKDLSAKAFASASASAKALQSQFARINQHVPTLVRGFGQLRTQVARTSESFHTAAKAAGLIGGLGVPAAIAAISRVAAAAAEDIDALSKASRELGVPLQKLRETVNTFSLENIAPAETIQGLKDAANAFALIQAGKFRGAAKVGALDPNLLAKLQQPTETLKDAWNDIQASVNAMSDPENRIAMSNLFGTDLFERVAAAGLTIDKMNEAAEKFRKLSGGHIMSDEEGKRVEEMLDAQKNFATSIRLLIQDVLPKLAPDVTRLVDGMTKWVAANQDLVQSGFIDAMKVVAGVISKAAEEIRAITNSEMFKTINAFMKIHGSFSNSPVYNRRRNPDYRDLGREDLPPIGSQEDVRRQLEQLGLPPGGLGANPEPWQRTGDMPGGLAAGGPVQKGGWNVVGERGPELVNWGAAGQVFSNAMSHRMISSSLMLVTPIGRLTAAISGLSVTVGRLNRTLAYGAPGAPGGYGAAGGPSWGSPGGGIAQPGLSSPTVPSIPQPGLSSPMIKAPQFRGPQSTWGSQMAAPTRAGAMTTGEPGTYRPVYKVSAADIDPRVINTVAGEARMKDPRGVDAVVNNMFNRLGTSGKLWSKRGFPESNLLEVARAPGQYTGYRRATEKEAALIRSRIEAIASGKVPDITAGANEYRAAYYHGRWMRKHAGEGVNIGGNVFARNRGETGTYAPYDKPHVAQKVDIGQGHLGVTIAMDKSGRPRVKRMAVQHPQNLTVKAGVDMTGRRYWRPGPQP